MPKRVTTQREQTRARLLDAAFSVFAEQGFHQASIADICSRAGYTRGAFYSNFESKDELFLALYELHNDQVVVELRTALELCRESRDPIAQFSSAFKHNVADNWDVYLIGDEFFLHSIRKPELRALLVSQYNRLRDEVTSVVQELATLAGRELTIDAGLLAYHALALRAGAIRLSLQDPEAVEPQMLDRLFLPGVFYAFSRPLPQP